ncbi:MAG: hypothetical protein GC146_02570 [Limimaricola sp.]|uniref:MerR family transcriptional regulator n=1 Tax=Limimaricola sp. TaxID=2211665 RepID=UPI001D757491|nr:MerR family transcriptional regulator [Limimaricola sp.]MBI1416084.1 hypothetical protein [Limimaricola sp.]
MNSANFAERLGVSQDNLRDWRRRGVSLGGAAVNGRVDFSDFDLIAARVMINLARAAFDLPDAWRAATVVAPWVASALNVKVPTDRNVTASGERPRFAVKTPAGVHLRASLETLADLDFSVASVILIDRVTDAVRAEMEADD